LADSDMAYQFLANEEEHASIECFRKWFFAILPTPCRYRCAAYPSSSHTHLSTGHEQISPQMCSEHGHMLKD
jgi:hypothetical protein